MSKAGVKFSEVKELLMKDEEFKTEYEKLKPQYDIIAQIIETRASEDITQEESGGYTKERNEWLGDRDIGEIARQIEAKRRQ